MKVVCQYENSHKWLLGHCYQDLCFVQITETALQKEGQIYGQSDELGSYWSNAVVNWERQTFSCTLVNQAKGLIEKYLDGQINRILTLTGSRLKCIKSVLTQGYLMLATKRKAVPFTRMENAQRNRFEWCDLRWIQI